MQGEKFLSVATIYGPNGGGKSTVLEALRFVKSFLLYQIILSEMQNTSARIMKAYCIVGLFTNQNTNRHGAQLLLTSHDITSMTSDVYRRDEIWFCAKNPENASMLYAPTTFRKKNGTRPRNDEIYGKQYMEGRYGADPYIKKILEWENEN